MLPDGMALELLHLPAAGGAPSTRPPLLFVHGSYHGAWCWQVRGYQSSSRVADAAALYTALAMPPSSTSCCLATAIDRAAAPPRRRSAGCRTLRLRATTAVSELVEAARSCGRAGAATLLSCCPGGDSPFSEAACMQPGTHCLLHPLSEPPPALLQTRSACADRAAAIARRQLASRSRCGRGGGSAGQPCQQTAASEPLCMLCTCCATLTCPAPAVVMRCFSLPLLPLHAARSAATWTR